TGGGAQFRESFQGTVTDISTTNLGNGSSANGQLFTFNFTVQNPATYLSPIPNYYAGRVITFQGPGAAANHSARIVAYTPLAPVPSPATGQPMVEASDPKPAGPVFPMFGENFVVSAAPSNGAGAGSPPASAGLDAFYSGWTNFNPPPPPQTPLSLMPNYAR